MPKKKQKENLHRIIFLCGFCNMSIHPYSRIQMEMGLINLVMLQQLIISQLIKVQHDWLLPERWHLTCHRDREKKQNIEAKTWSKLSVYCRHKTTKTLPLFARLA